MSSSEIVSVIRLATAVLILYGFAHGLGRAP